MKKKNSLANLEITTDTERESIIRKFWQLVKEAQFEETRALLSDDFKAVHPHSREIYANPETYVSVYKAYPGRWYTDISRIDKVSSNEWVVVVELRGSFDNSKPSTLPVFSEIAYMTLEGKKISKMTEYFLTHEKQEKWREKYPGIELY